jgi:thioredoxin-like negative regulator of GroEL
MFLHENTLCAVYYSGPGCAVCEQLKPKLFGMLGERFPRLAIAAVDCSKARTLAAEQSVFTIPTLVVYIEGREAFRYARSFSPIQVAEQLQRPYELFFGR